MTGIIPQPRAAREVPACVLVPGAGEAPGIDAIKALRMVGYRGQIVATDSDPLSPGLELADTGAVLPCAGADDFFERAMELIRREKVEVILPTSGLDTPAYAEHVDELRAAGVTLVGCAPEVLALCADKWRFHQVVSRRFPVPRTFLAPPPELAFPCVVKPRRGLNGHGVSVSQDSAALERRLSDGDDVLIQEYLPGVEYAVDVLSDLDGRPLIAVPRLRLAVQEGVSVRGQVVHDDVIEQLCLALAGALQAKGPVCMQLRRDSAGTARFIEVRPRMGGATVFTALAGLNVAALCLDLAAGRPLPALRFSEIAVVRYFEEIVLIGEDRRRRRPRNGGRYRSERARTASGVGSA